MSRSLIVCLLVYSFSQLSYGAELSPVSGTAKTFAANITAPQNISEPSQTSVQTSKVEIKNLPEVVPSSITKNNDTAPASPDKVSTEAPPIEPVKPTVVTNNTTQAPTVAPTAATTKAAPVTTPSSTTNATEVVPSITTKTPPVSTEHTIIPSSKSRFDGPSFVGGIILTVGLVAMGFIGFKYYKAHTGRNYHTL